MSTVNASNSNVTSAVLDSGATHHLSAVKSDFAEVSAVPTVTLRTVEGITSKGEPRGYIGTLRPNNLGVTRAVFVPGLPIGRIVSTNGLLSSGWKVVLSQDTSYIIRDSVKHSVINAGDNLPTLCLEFRSGPSIIAHTVESSDAFLSRASVVSPKSNTPPIKCIAPPYSRRGSKYKS